ncbi:hypothetical protein [uncultured Draconibacterium sp.]|uniref:DUF7793 family protein n=1 Tax=uncultured Draconibacterium sp. TaxID=1573823 RepID=UPI0032180052
MENSERAEFQIGGDTVFYRNDSTIQVIVTGIQTLEMALEMKKLCLKLSSKTESKYNYLIDINKCGKNEPGAREIWIELSGHEKTNKVATFGMNPVAQVIANFVIGTHKGNNLRFFNSEKDAVNWLNE